MPSVPHSPGWVGVVLVTSKPLTEQCLTARDCVVVLFSPCVVYAARYGNEEVRQRVINGERLQKPPACPEFLYDLCLMCWDADETVRPSADAIRDALAANLNLPSRAGSAWTNADFTPVSYGSPARRPDAVPKFCGGHASPTGPAGDVQFGVASEEGYSQVAFGSGASVAKPAKPGRASSYLEVAGSSPSVPTRAEAGPGGGFYSALAPSGHGSDTGGAAGGDAAPAEAAPVSPPSAGTASLANENAYFDFPEGPQVVVRRAVHAHAAGCVFLGALTGRPLAKRTRLPQARPRACGQTAPHVAAHRFHFKAWRPARFAWLRNLRAGCQATCTLWRPRTCSAG